MKVVLCCVAAFWLTWAFSETNLCIVVGSALSGIRTDYGAGFPRAGLIREDWDGAQVSTNRHFIELQNLASNQWSGILSCLSVLTNQDDRMIVIAASASGTEGDYLNRIDCIADLVLSNNATAFELIYFRNRCEGLNHYAANVFLRRYNEPSVSNLIMKVRAAGGLSESVSELFSGEEKRLYDEAMSEGLIP